MRFTYVQLSETKIWEDQTEKEGGEREQGGDEAGGDWELLSTTLQRANAFAIKKRYYETLPNTDEVP